MSRRSRVRLRPLSRAFAIGGVTVGLTASLLSATASPAAGAVCNVTGITGGDVGSTG